MKLLIQYRVVRFLIFFVAILNSFNIESRSLYLQEINEISDDDKKELISSPTPGEFPIVASTVFNSKIGPRVDDLKNIRECGFNLCRHSTNVRQFEKLLECMEGTGLKLLIHNSSFEYNSDRNDSTDKWKEDIISFVNKFKDNPLVAGWQFKDEPKWADLSELQKRYQVLRDADPSHFILMNLVGELSGPYTGPCKTLWAYVDSIQNRFDVDVWSSDNYPIMVKDGKLEVHYQEFYNDLEVFSKKSKDTRIPMWTYCESMEYQTLRYARPAATVPYLSFQIFSALAYGSQGIVYWTYWQRPSTHRQTYISALVDIDGNKTHAWFSAKKINEQLRTLSFVFLGAEMVKCYHTGNIKMKGTLPTINNQGPIELLTNEDEGVLVSFLKNTRKNYVIIVNHSIDNKQKVKIKFSKNYTIERLNVSSSCTLKRNRVKNQTNMTLEPGGYAIFEVIN